MEFLSENTPMPVQDGAPLEIYPWMAVRADSVKTNSLTLIPRGANAPRISGMPQTRKMMWRVRALDGEEFEIVFPASESNVAHPFFTGGASYAAGFSSNPERLSAFPSHPDRLSFRCTVPPKSFLYGMMFVEILLEISGMEYHVPNLPDQHLLFNIQAFKSPNADLSNAVAIGENVDTGHCFVRVVSGNQAYDPNPPPLNPQFNATFTIEQDPNPAETPLTQYYFFEIEKVYAQETEVKLHLASLTLIVTDCDGEPPQIG